MTWIRRASMTAALAALLASGACAAKQEPAQPAAGSDAPAASGQPLASPVASNSSQPADEAESEAASTPAVGSAAVAATVRDAAGEPVVLASAWQTGPAVLVFYRGHW